MWRVIKSYYSVTKGSEDWGVGERILLSGCAEVI